MTIRKEKKNSSLDVLPLWLVSSVYTSAVAKIDGI
jgi:hypothetical protein